jgi:hypothetical protein
MDLDTEADLPSSAAAQRLGSVDFNTALPQKAATPARNPKLDSFEALMDAMDAELHNKKASATSSKRKTPGSSGAAASSRDKPTSNLNVVDETSDDEDADMEAELASLLQRDPADLEDVGQLGLIKNLLASFNSQEGFAGPVSNLAGRLDPKVKLPRDA